MSSPAPGSTDHSVQTSSLSSEETPPKQSLYNSIQLEQIAKGAAILAVVLYALGLLVANESLLAFDIPDFSTFRPKYLLTGSWAFLFILLASLPLWPPVILLFTGHKLTTFRDWTKLALATFGGIALCAMFLPYAFSASYATSWPSIWDIGRFVGFACVCVFCGGLALTLVGYSPYRILLSFLSLMTLLACTNEFALHFYQSIPQGLGGGRPTVATLVLNKEGVKFWNRIGWETLAGDEEAVRTGPVAILHQTDQELWLLRVNRERTDSAIPEWIAIQKSLVNGIACGCKNIQLPAQPKK